MGNEFAVYVYLDAKSRKRSAMNRARGLRFRAKITGETAGLAEIPALVREARKRNRMLVWALRRGGEGLRRDLGIARFIGIMQS